MKKIILFAVIAIVLCTSIFIACKKEALAPSGEVVGNNAVIPTMEKIVGGPIISAEKGLLVFGDTAGFNYYVKKLQAEVDMVNTQFPDRNPSDQLRIFESMFAYQSLRAKLAAEQEQWLNAQTENGIVVSGLQTADPVDRYATTEIESSLLNAKAQVKIGGKLYQLTENGYLEVVNGDYATLAQLERGINSFSFTNVRVYENASNVKASSDCRTDKRASKHFPSIYNSNRRMKCVVSHWTHPWSAERVIAKTESQEKKKNWLGIRKWCDVKAWNYAKVHGYVTDPNACTGQHNFNTGGWYAEKYDKHVEHQIGTRYRKTKSGWVKGDFKSFSGEIRETLTVTW